MMIDGLTPSNATQHRKSALPRFGGDLAQPLKVCVVLLDRQSRDLYTAHRNRSVQFGNSYPDLILLA